MSSAADEKPNAGTRVAEFLTRHPVRSLLLALLLLLVTLPGAQWVRVDFQHTGLFYEDDPLLERFESFEGSFGNDDQVVVVVHHPEGIFRPESVALLRELTEELWRLPLIVRVDSLANFEWLHAADDELEIEAFLGAHVELSPEELSRRAEIAVRHETMANYLVSRDGKTGLLYARMQPMLGEPSDFRSVTLAARDLVDRASGRDGHQVLLGGSAPIAFGFEDVATRDLSVLVPALLLLTMAFLAAAFRSVGGVVMPMAVVSLSIVSAVGMSGYYGLELTTFTAILPQVLIAIGVADSVHVLQSFFAALRRGVERSAAARYALEKNFLPTLFTTLTTAIGFFSFITAASKPVYALGILVGTGAMLAWLFTYLTLGPLLVLFPMGPVRLSTPDKGPLLEPLAERLAALIDRGRRPIIVGMLALGAIALGVSTLVTVNADPVKYFVPSYGPRITQDFLITEGVGVLSFEIVVDSGAPDGLKDPALLRQVHALQRRIEEMAGVTKTVSIVDTLMQMNRALHDDAPEAWVIADTREAIGQQLLLYSLNLPSGMDMNDRLTPDHQSLRISALSTETDSVSHMAVVRQIEQAGRELGLNVAVTGKTNLYQSMQGYIITTFVWSIGAALILISGLLAFALRSIRLGLLAMLPNMVPLLWGGVVLVALGKTLDIGTVAVAAICLGVVVDDTIHVIANFRRHLAGGSPPREAVAQMIAHTGSALLLTTIILVCGFGTFAFATFEPVRWLGILAAAILTCALVVDLTLLPALLIELHASPGPADQGETRVAAAPTAR